MSDEKKTKNIRQVSDDAFYMAIISLYGREPDHVITSQTDINDFKITAEYEPNETKGSLPFFSDFEIINKNDPNFRVPLKRYKDRYMEFRNLILSIVQKAKQKEDRHGK